MKTRYPNTEKQQMIWSLIVAGVIGIIVWAELLSPTPVLGEIDEKSPDRFEITAPKLQ